MRDDLTDIIKQRPKEIKFLKFVGDEKQTRVSGTNESKTVIFEALLDNPVKEFIGEFGISNIDLLAGLLNFPNYKVDGASLKVKRRKLGDKEIVEEFQFRDAKNIGADFRCMSPERVPGVGIMSIKWDISIKPTKSKLAEFEQLTRLYNEVDKYFRADVQDGNLLFRFGEETSSSHRGAMIFAEGIDADLKTQPKWSHGDFTTIMRLAGDRDTTLHIMNRGVLCVEVKTNFGLYKYYLRTEN